MLFLREISQDISGFQRALGCVNGFKMFRLNVQVKPHLDTNVCCVDVQLNLLHLSKGICKVSLKCGSLCNTKPLPNT